MLAVKTIPLPIQFNKILADVFGQLVQRQPRTVYPMNIALSASFPQPHYQALRLSPSKKSPHGSTLRPYHGFPHLLGSDPRRGSLLSGYGEVGVSRFAFVSEEDCAPFGDPFAYPVPDDLVLCAVAKDADPAKLSLPNTLASQTNLTFLIAIDGALGDALADQLAALGLKVERCTPADLVHIAALPTLDTHTAPCDYPPMNHPRPRLLSPLKPIK